MLETASVIYSAGILDRTLSPPADAENGPECNLATRNATFTSFRQKILRITSF